MPDNQDSFSIKAPAKINLYLEVLAGKENGYHDIRSVVVPVSFYDLVILEKTSGTIETIVESDGLVGREALCLADQEDNLTTKAAILLKQATDHSSGVRVHLKKNIPVGGGLGGGSSDAAAVLKGLNSLWQTDVPRETLMKIGAQLGCDVPAMIHGGIVCMEGCGEKVIPIPNKEDQGWWVVIVNPGFSVSTQDIYSRYSSSLTHGQIPFSSMTSALKEGKLDLIASSLFNGLQETVFRKYPLIEIVAERLKQAGSVGVLLAGSGASVFGMARDEKHACSIDASVRKNLEFPVWSKVTRTLPDGVMAAHGPLEA